MLKDAYYFWLCDMVEQLRPNTTYNLLLKALYSYKFKWFIPNDNNRAFEGKNLREMFCREEGIDYEVDKFDEEVSMFEVILALAIRCESMTSGVMDDLTLSSWFWKLLENVDLPKFNDIDFYYYNGDQEVEKILDKIVNRTYKRSGEGGLFPLIRPKKDQRKVELWYQMCQFLIENFYMHNLIV